jgi:hypothetical protein
VGEHFVNSATELSRFVFDLAPGAAGDPPASSLETLLATPVGLECGHGVVKGLAVGFDDQSLLPPEEVGLETALLDLDEDVHLRRTHPVVMAHIQETPLEHAADRAGGRRDRLDRESQLRDAPAAAASFDQLAHRRQVEELAHLRLCNRLAQLPGEQETREIEQCPRDGGAWNGTDISSVDVRKGSVSVSRDPARYPSPPAGRDDVDAGPALSTDAPEIGRRTMRNHRLDAAGQRRG